MHCDPREDRCVLSTPAVFLVLCTDSFAVKRCRMEAELHHTRPSPIALPLVSTRSGSPLVLPASVDAKDLHPFHVADDTIDLKRTLKDKIINKNGVAEERRKREDTETPKLRRKRKNLEKNQYAVLEEFFTQCTHPTKELKTQLSGSAASLLHFSLSVFSWEQFGTADETSKDTY